MRSPGLDLVVWPETAVPDDIRQSERSYDLVHSLVTNGVPILVGSMDLQWTTEREPDYFNSSFLFDTNGVLVQGYDKRHLVMFGEYVPLQEFLPFMTAMTPIEASFTAGRTSTVFRLASTPVTFSALICFEDTVAALARASVLNGARLLINQTNDAWFDVSSASRQHMAHCVFRCIENRVPALRAANSGVTCTIDAWGRIGNVLEREDGSTVFPGFVCAGVMVPGEGAARTFYTRYGDRGGQAAAGVAVMMVVCILVGARRETRAARARL
jgi:apolipoprotein N-acyltransferase